MLESSDRDILIRVDENVKNLRTELVGDNGRIPNLEKKHEAVQDQVNFWRGALAFIGLLVLVFGGWFLEHVFAGKP